LSESKTNIKQLEKRKRRFWSFKRKLPSGKVEPLSETNMTKRLRNIWIYTMKTMGVALRETIGEKGLKNMYEHQAQQYAKSSRISRLKASDLAEWTIKYNLQPQGIEATFRGNEKEATITTQDCPLPQKIIARPEFLRQRTFEQKPLLSDFGAEKLSAKGEWPPKRLESCHICLVIIPKIGENLGFTWEHGLTKGPYKKCLFKITINEEKNKINTKSAHRSCNQVNK
jgi:hypothetical protein